MAFHQAKKVIPAIGALCGMSYFAHKTLRPDNTTHLTVRHDASTAFNMGNVTAKSEMGNMTTMEAFPHMRDPDTKVTYISVEVNDQLDSPPATAFRYRQTSTLWTILITLISILLPVAVEFQSLTVFLVGTIVTIFIYHLSQYEVLRMSGRIASAFSHSFVQSCAFALMQWFPGVQALKKDVADNRSRSRRIQRRLVQAQKLLRKVNAEKTLLINKVKTEPTNKEIRLTGDLQKAEVDLIVKTIKLGGAYKEIEQLKQKVKAQEDDSRRDLRRWYRREAELRSQENELAKAKRIADLDQKAAREAEEWAKEQGEALAHQREIELCQLRPQITEVRIKANGLSALLDLTREQVRDIDMEKIHLEQQLKLKGQADKIKMVRPRRELKIRVMKTNHLRCNIRRICTANMAGRHEAQDHVLDQAASINTGMISLRLRSETVESELATLQSNSQSIRKALQDLATSKEAEDSKDQILQEKNAELQAAKDELEAERTWMRTSQAERERDAAISKASEESKDLALNQKDAELQAMKNELDTERNRAGRIQRDRDAAITKEAEKIIKVKDDELQAVRYALETERTRTGEFQQGLDNALSQCRGAENQVHELQRVCHESTSAIEAEQSRTKELQEEKDQVMNALQTEQNRSNELNGRQEEADNRSREAQDQVGGLQRELEQAKNDVSQLSDQLSTATHDRIRFLNLLYETSKYDRNFAHSLCVLFSVSLLERAFDKILRELDTAAENAKWDDIAKEANAIALDEYSVTVLMMDNFQIDDGNLEMRRESLMSEGLRAVRRRDRMNKTLSDGDLNSSDRVKAMYDALKVPTETPQLNNDIYEAVVRDYNSASSKPTVASEPTVAAEPGAEPDPLEYDPRFPNQLEVTIATGDASSSTGPLLTQHNRVRRIPRIKRPVTAPAAPNPSEGSSSSSKPNNGDESDSNSKFLADINTDFTLFPVPTDGSSSNANDGEELVWDPNNCPDINAQSAWPSAPIGGGRSSNANDGEGLAWDPNNFPDINTHSAGPLAPIGVSSSSKAIEEDEEEWDGDPNFLAAVNAHSAWPPAPNPSMGGNGSSKADNEDDEDDEDDEEDVEWEDYPKFFAAINGKYDNGPDVLDDMGLDWEAWEALKSKGIEAPTETETSSTDPAQPGAAGPSSISKGKAKA